MREREDVSIKLSHQPDELSLTEAASEHAHDGKALSIDLAVDLQDGELTERHCRLDRGPFFPLDSDILVFLASLLEDEADGLGAAARTKVLEHELGHC